MEKNKCEICGRKIKDDNRFCYKCKKDICKCGEPMTIGSRMCRTCYIKKPRSGKKIVTPK